MQPIRILRGTRLRAAMSGSSVWSAPGEVCIDEGLVERLPLPLARLYLCAHYGKTVPERHDAAFCLWEASLRLLASVAIVEYAALADHDPQLAERLKCLARPSFGHWWEFVRRLVPVLAEREVAGFAEVRQVLLGRARDDLPRCAGLHARLEGLRRAERQAGTGGKSSEGSTPRSTVRLTELIDLLVDYRNKYVGHKGVKSSSFFEGVWKPLLLAGGELLNRVDFLATRRLYFVAEVLRQSSGGWLVKRSELTGHRERAAPTLEFSEAEAARLPRPDRLYVMRPAGHQEAGPASMRAMHPLLIGNRDCSEVYFLNGRKGTCQADYLSFESGDHVSGDGLEADHRELLAGILGTPVDDRELREWGTLADREDPRAPDDAEAAVRRVGEFELLSVLGRGRQGTVYRAWQPSLGRQVALKQLSRLGDPRMEARFQREIRALGRVNHPNVVKTFTSHSDGEQWYFTMELVEGASLDKVCGLLAGSDASTVDNAAWRTLLSKACEESRGQEELLEGSEEQSAAADHDVSPPSAETPWVELRGPCTDRDYTRHAVEIGRQVAHAAHALHEAGVIHRDIKPANIILTPDGVHAVLMDLGLVQLMDSMEGRLTRTRQFVGTLRYASPEQVLGATLDARSDIYSLGATIWELLTLRPIYGVTESMADVEIMMRIASTEPERPSKYNPHVPPDLDWIVLKCLDKDRARRFATAAELATDLRRWQQDLPVLARAPSVSYVVKKYVRRNWLPIGAVTALCVSLLLALAASATSYVAMKFHRQKEELQTAQAAAKKESERAARGAVQLGTNNAERLLKQRDYLGALAWYAHARKMETVPRRASVLQRLLGTGLEQLPKPAAIWTHGAGADRVEFDPHGDRALAAYRDGSVALIDLGDGKVSRWQAHQGPAIVASFSPDGRYLVTAGADGKSRVWNAADRSLHATCEHSSPVRFVRFNHSGTHFVTGSADKTARIWDVATGKAVGDVLAHRGTVTHAAFSPDDRVVITSSEDSTARVWDSRTGRPLDLRTGKSPEPTAAPPRPLAVTTPNRPLVTPPVSSDAPPTSEPGNVSSDEKPQIPVGTLSHDGPVCQVEYSPEGGTIATAEQSSRSFSRRSSIGVWAVQPIVNLKWHSGYLQEGAVRKIAMSPDGSSALSMSTDGTAVLLELTTGNPLSLFEQFESDDVATPQSQESPVLAGVFSPDGKAVVTACADGVVRRWDPATGADKGKVLQHAAGFTAAAFTRDGLTLITAELTPSSTDTATGGGGNTVSLWDTRTGVRRSQLPQDAAGVDLVCSSDGKTLLVVRDDDTIAEIDVGSGAVRNVSSVKRQCGRILAFSADVRKLVSQIDSRVRLWDVRTGTSQGKPLRILRDVTTAAFSPDGRMVFAALEGSSEAILWSPETDEIWHNRLEFGGDRGDSVGELTSAVFTSDGQAVVAGHDDGSVSAFRFNSSEMVKRSLTFSDDLTHLQFSPSSSWLAAAGTEGTVVAWDDFLHDKPKWERKLGFTLRQVSFSPDGRLLAVAGKGGAAVLDASSGQLLLCPLGDSRPVNAMAFHPNGRWLASASDDGTVRLWDLSKHLMRTIGWDSPPLREDNGVEINRVSAVSPDGSRAATIDPDGEGRLYDLVADKEARFLSDQNADIAQFGPDGKRLVVVSKNGHFDVWETSRESPTRLWSHTCGYTSHMPTFSLDGRLLDLNFDGTHHIWNADTGKLLYTVDDTSILFPDDPVDTTPLGVFPDFLLWQAKDKTASVKKQNLKDNIRREYPDVASYDSVTLGSSGSWLVAMLPGGAVGVLDRGHGGPIREFDVRAIVSSTSERVSTALCADDRLLVVWGDTDAEVWDVETLLPLCLPVRFSGLVLSAVASRDGRQLIAVLSNGAIQVCRFPPPRSDEESALRTNLASCRSVAVNQYDLRLVPALQDRPTDGLIDKPLARNSRSWHLNELADCVAAERWFAARWHLDRMTEGPAENIPAEVPLYRGLTYAAEGDFDRAKSNYDAARRQIKRDGRSLSILGRSYGCLQDGRNAVEVFAQCLELESEKGLALYWRANAHSQLADSDAAIADCTAALQAAPELETPLRVLRAQLNARHESWEATFQDLVTLGKNHPGLVSCFNVEMPSEARESLLLRVSKQEDPTLSLWACQELRRLGYGPDKILGTLVTLLGNPNLRLGAIAALGEGRSTIRPLVPGLILATSDGDPGIRAQATATLRNLAALTAFDASTVRELAVDALAHVGAQESSTLSRLLELARHEERSEVKAAIARALGTVGKGDANALREIVKLLADEDKDVREAASLSFTQHGEQAIAAVADAAALLTRGGTDVRLTVIEAIGDLRPVSTAANEALRVALKDPSSEVRLLAVKKTAGLEFSANPLASGLEPLLNNKDEVESVRDWAAFGLGGIGARQSLPSLLGALDNDSTPFAVRVSAAGAAWKLGKPSESIVKVLTESLTKEDVSQSVLLDALNIVSEHGRGAKPWLPQLVSKIGDGSPSVRKSAVVALAGLGVEAQSTVSLLRQKLAGSEDQRESDPDVRREILSALSRIDKRAAAEQSRLLLSDDDFFLRLIAVEAIWREERSAQGVLPTLLDGLASKNVENSEDIRRRAVEAVSKIGPSASELVPTLMVAMDDSVSLVREWACDALGRIGEASAPAVPRLLQALGDPHEATGVRSWAAFGLGEIGTCRPEVVTALTKALSDAEISVRIKAAEALGELGPEAQPAFESLVKSLADRDPDVREMCAFALARINAAAAVEACKPERVPQPERAADYHFARGNAFAESGDFASAQREFAEASRLNLQRSAFRQALALSQLAAGDVAVCQKTCQDWREHPSGSISEAGAWLRTSFHCFDTGPAGDEWLSLAEGVAAARKGIDFDTANFGAMLFRMGRFDEAIAQLELSNDLRWPMREAGANEAWVRFVLAMAYHRSGDPDAARKQLDRGIELTAGMKERPDATVRMRPNWETRLMLRLARTEAESLITPK